MKRPRLLSALLVAAVVSVALLPACSVVDPPALSVGSWTLTREALMNEVRAVQQSSELKTLLGESQSGQTPSTDTVSPTLTATILNIHAQSQLFVEEAKRLNLTVTPEDRQAATQELEQGLASSSPQGSGAPGGVSVLGPLADPLLEGSAARMALARKLSVGDVDIDKEVARQYEANKSKLAKTCIGAILVSAVPVTADAARQQPTPGQLEAAQQEASALRARIQGGAPFAEVARSESDDPQTKADGGKLGCFDNTQMQQELGQLSGQLSELAVGTVTEVVELTSGAALFTVTDRQVPTLEQVRPEIEQFVKQNLSQEKVRAESKTIAKRTAVLVDPLFGSWDIEALQVIPPSGAQAPSTTLSLIDPPVPGGIDIAPQVPQDPGGSQVTDASTPAAGAGAAGSAPPAGASSGSGAAPSSTTSPSTGNGAPT